MCLSCIPVKRDKLYPVQGSVMRSAFVPCGQCEDCRDTARRAWAWRLVAELQHCLQNGYKVGFLTLTYNDEHLPQLPEYVETPQKFIRENYVCTTPDGLVYSKREKPLKVCYRQGPLVRLKPDEIESSYRATNCGGLACFDKTHVRKMLDYLKKKGLQLRGMKYFAASEFGSVTKRPHYHLVIAWKSEQATAEQVHAQIHHWWCEYAQLGFISPRDPCGGRSARSGRVYKPFEVVDLVSALNTAFYVAKYVTKDLYYYEYATEGGLSPDIKPYLKRYLPFHIQSKSLGFSAVASLSDAQKIQLLCRGMMFLGSNRLSMPPMYIKNKLIFKPCYIVDKNGDRLVRKDTTAFFDKYFSEIMSLKVDYYSRLFTKFKSIDYWSTSGVDFEKFKHPNGTTYTSAASFARDCTHFLEDYDFGCSPSEAYIYYFGCKYDYCFTDFKLTYMNRYKRPALSYSALLIDYEHWRNIQFAFGSLFSLCRFVPDSVPDTDSDKMVDAFNLSEYEVAHYAL